jgi:DNA adenine methylase
MSKFFFAYTGCKRHESKYVIEILSQIKNIEKYTFVEPFCGSCHVSIDVENELKIKKFHVNDNDEGLINFLNSVSNDKFKKKCEKKYNEFVSFIGEKYSKKKNKEISTKIKSLDASKADNYYCIQRLSKGGRIGFISTSKGIYRTPKFSLNNMENTCEFFKKCKITCDDYTSIFDEYKDNSKAILFIDPPYFDSRGNCFYHEYDKDHIRDKTKVFVDIARFLKVCKCKVIMIINSTAITDYLYEDFIVKKYDFIYQITKKKAIHMIVSNIKT